MEENRASERFEPLGELGRGRRAVVLAAEDTWLGRRVALKRALDAGDEPLLREEARRLARLTTPHVVRLHDVLAGPPFALVLEHLQGRTLRAHLREQGRMPGKEATRLVRELLEALRAVHAGGLVHGDVKPENLWLDPEGTLKLLDLGALGDATALYSPPEAALGEELRPTADLYSAGVVAWEILAGRPPFDATDAAELAVRKRTQSAPPVGSAGAAVSPGVEAWLARALAASPQARFADADTALQAWVEATSLEPPQNSEVTATLLHPTAWARLVEVLDAAPASAERAIALVAEPGAGKSHLLGQWCATARERGDTALLVRAPDSLPRRPFAAWCAALAAASQVHEWVAELEPRTSGGARRESEEQERIVRALERGARQGGVAVAVDDLEACDAATRRLALRLVQEAAALRLAVVVAVSDPSPARAGCRTRAALAASGCTRIDLGPPEPERWRGFLSAALGVPSVSDALVDHVRARSGGNPRFARLLLDALRDRGALWQIDGAWIFRPEIATEDVPRAMEDLLAELVAPLGPPALEMFSIAAVQGERFDPALLAHRLGRTVAETCAELESMARTHGSLRRQAGGFAFRPPVLAAFLRQRMATERLQSEHAQLAEALLATATADDAAVGEHLSRAGLAERALPHLERAARAALGRNEFESALASLDRAGGGPEPASEAEALARSELGLLRARALQGLAAWDAAAAELERTVVLARAWGQDAVEMRALRAHGEIEYARSRFEAAIERYLEAELCAARLGDAAELHELALQVGNIHFERGELPAALAEYERTLEYATQSGDLELEARAANNVALVESVQGRKDRAVQFFDRSLARFRALGREDAVARLYQNIGQVYLELGNWAEARNFFHRCMQASERTGQDSLLAVACLDAAETDVRLGALDEAAAAVERALAIARERGDEVGVANVFRVQANLAAAGGDWAGAESRLLESIERLQRLGQTLHLGLCWKDLGAVRLRAGRTAAAAEALATARRLFAALDAPQHAAEVETLWARCQEGSPCRP